MSMPKTSKMLQFLNWRVRITIHDHRWLVGTFVAFDKHMNIVLSDTEEFRRIIPKGKKKADEREEKRVLGFVLLRGENIVSMVPETRPAPKKSDLAGRGQPGPGMGRAVGRGMPMAAPMTAPPHMMGRGGVMGAPPMPAFPAGYAGPPPPQFPAMGRGG
ncbi:hypothetical protein PBRA_005042, partial [Plasmodiophora brassicae]